MMVEATLALKAFNDEKLETEIIALGQALNDKYVRTRSLHVCR